MKHVAAINAVPADPAAGSRLEIYKLLVEMSDRVSQRRQANNNFYLTVNTGIVGLSAYLTSSVGAHMSGAAIAGAGIVVCVAWRWSIQSYKSLNSAKFKVIHRLEALLPFQAYDDEWKILTNADPAATPGSGRRKHTPFHQVEVIVPWVFALLHALELSWSSGLSDLAGHVLLTLSKVLSG